MTTNHTDPHPDPVDLAIASLAAPRWNREPDWRSFQETLMTTRTFGWRRFSLLSLLACGCLAAGTAAGVAWERFTASGVMKLNNGTTANVSLDVTPQPGNAFKADLKSDKDLSSGGTMEITLPDGRKAMLATAPADAKAIPGQTREITLPNGQKVNVPAPARSAACLAACGSEKCTGACLKK